MAEQAVMNPGVRDNLLALKANILAKSAGYTVTTADGLFVMVKCSVGSDFTITLPAAATATGMRVVVKKTDANATTLLTIDGSGAETIDGVANLVIGGQYAFADLVCDGTTWSIRGLSSNAIVVYTGAASGSHNFTVSGALTLGAVGTYTFNFFQAGTRVVSGVAGGGGGGAGVGDYGSARQGGGGGGGAYDTSGESFVPGSTTCTGGVGAAGAAGGNGGQTYFVLGGGDVMRLGGGSFGTLGGSGGSDGRGGAGGLALAGSNDQPGGAGGDGGIREGVGAAGNGAAGDTGGGGGGGGGGDSSPELIGGTGGAGGSGRQRVRHQGRRPDGVGR